ncbi:MAG TPA: four helix bundle protein [Candidatus Binatia bacterium]
MSLNIAEGNGRWHVRERRNFFRIARGSAFECVPLVKLCRRKKLMTEVDLSGEWN